MPDQAFCPSPQALQAFALGLLPSTEVEQWAGHVEHCACCVQSLDKLVAGDTFTDALAHSTYPQPEPMHLRTLLARLKTVVAAAPREATVDQLSASTDSLGSAPGDADSFTFLAPPQGPGELGRLGHYRVLGVLGRGGMGMVLRAEDTQLGRQVALKVILPNAADKPAARERFAREARAAARLQHDHIVTIYQVSEDRGVPYLAMEFLEGVTLEQRLRDSAPLALAATLRIGREVASGLAAAHEQSLVHRDIKPGNLWLDQKTGRTKILDFGLARSANDDVYLTQLGLVVGTPAYMAPEQARGDKVDGRADLFSLGCVLYRLCTGEQPFKAATTMGMLMALATTEPPAPRQRNPQIPEALSQLVMQLLAKDAEKRPTSAVAVVAALQAIEQQPAPSPQNAIVTLPTPQRPSEEPTLAVSAAPASQTAPARRPAWLLAVLGAVAAVVLLAIGTVLFWDPPNGTVGSESNLAEKKSGAVLDRESLRIEVGDPDTQVVINHGEYRITSGSKREITLAPGQHSVQVKRGDLEFETNMLTLKRGDKVTLRVALLPDKIQVAAGKHVLGERPLAQKAQPANGLEVAVPAASTNYALELDAKASVTLTSLKLKETDAFTFECWLTAPAAKEGAQIASFASCLRLELQPAQRLLFSVTQSLNDRKYAMGTTPGSGPVHIACVYSHKQIRLFLNGKLASEKEIPAGLHVCPTVSRLGAMEWQRGADCVLDEIRISQSARYDKEFVPARRHAPDAETLALYHCDEGQGDVLKDSSDNNHHGKIVGARWVKQDGAGNATPSKGALPATFRNDLSIEFALIPGGKAWLGGGGRKAGTRPVEIPCDFYMSNYEVTQEQWQLVMNTTPSWFARNGGGKEEVKKIPSAQLNRFPVENVSWQDCLDFVERLNNKTKERGWVYRLPTEDEWEYACRGGPAAQDTHHSSFDYYVGGPTQALLAQEANFAQTGLLRTDRVGAHAGNRLGLYDMHGNVWEWCRSSRDGAHGVLRGGSWREHAGFCRAAHRYDVPELRRNDYGFRLVRVPASAQ